MYFKFQLDINNRFDNEELRLLKAPCILFWHNASNMIVLTLQIFLFQEQARKEAEQREEEAKKRAEKLQQEEQQRKVR